MTERARRPQFSAAPQLDIRKHQILEAVVVDYTRTGAPIGSQLLAAHLASWSSATIRNELANLVEDGYLIQPHTSSGRVPSDRGYRYYVNFIMEEEPVAPEVRRIVDSLFRDPPRQFEDLLDRSALALARATDALAIIAAPRARNARLRHVDFVEMEDPRTVLIVLVLEGNIVKEKMMPVGRPVLQEELTRLAGEINLKARGMEMGDLENLIPVNDIRQERGGPPLRSELIGAVGEFLRDLDTERGNFVIHDGMRNLLKQPEFDDISRLEQVMEVLEEEQIISRLIAEIGAEIGSGADVRIVIGTENAVEQLDHCSLVFTSYRLADGRSGTVGVLGPTRMQYSQVAPRLKLVAQHIEACLREDVGREHL